MTTIFYTVGNELWAADGAGNAQLVDDINSEPDSANFSNLVVINGVAYFAANDSTDNEQLWRSDGTTAGTYVVSTAPQGPVDLAAMNGTLYFDAYDPINGGQLWESDGTAAGTEYVDVIEGAGSPGPLVGSTPIELTAVGSLLFFEAYDDYSGDSEGLWRTDGTAAGTVKLLDPSPGYASADNIQNLTDVGGTAYFSTLPTSGDGSDTAYELWKSDGTVGGTVRVAILDPDPGNFFWPGPYDFVAAGSELFFVETDPNEGYQLWVSDGTGAGTKSIATFDPGNTSSLSNYLQDLTDVNGTLYFAASDGTTLPQLYKSDGTSAGTVEVSDVPGGIDPNSLIAVGDTLFFFADDDVNGMQLWKSDGTSAGTVMVKAINAPIGSDPFDSQLMIAANGLLYFAAQVGSDTQLWQSDGTASGTVEVIADFNNVGEMAIAAGMPASGGSGVTVNAGNSPHVVSGATESGDTIDSGGTEIVESGGTTISTVISGGGVQYIGSSGVASGTQVASGGAEVVFGADDGALLSGTQYDNGTASGGITFSGGFELVAPGASAIGMDVESGGVQYIGSGGSAGATRVAPGGAEIVFGSDAGGAAISGTQYDFNLVSGGTLLSGGFELVISGASAVGVNVAGGGVQYIGAGGTASATQVAPGGAEIVFGSDVGGTLISGTQYDFNLVSGGTLSGAGFQLVASGATASGLNVESGTQQYIGMGGSAVATQIAPGGAEVIFGSDSGAAVSGTQYVFGIARGGAVSDGGYEEIESGGTAVGMAVASGGVTDVGAGGTASGVTIARFAAELVHGTDIGAALSGTEYVYGLASATAVDNGGYAVVSAGGNAIGVTIAGGGAMLLAAGAMLSGAVISGGGILEILGGNTIAQNFDPLSGATLEFGSGFAIQGTAPPDVSAILLAGGTASGSIVGGGDVVAAQSGSLVISSMIGSGAYASAASGSLVSAAIISGGTAEFAGGVQTGSAPTAFAGGGELILDASMQFSGSIAGFSVPDSIDLADIPYVASGTTATTPSWTQAAGNASGTLVVSQGGHSADLALLGQYLPGSFALASDGHGGTLVTDPSVAETIDPNPLVLAAARPS